MRDTGTPDTWTQPRIGTTRNIWPLSKKLSGLSSEQLRHRPQTTLAMPTLMQDPAPARAVPVRNAPAASTMLLDRVNSPLQTDAVRLRVTRIVLPANERSKGRLQRLQPLTVPLRQPMAPISLARP